MARVRCCTDLDKTVLTQNFDKRNWINVASDEDWNFFWFVIYLPIVTEEMNIFFCVGHQLQLFVQSLILRMIILV
jgi:hypothetical protein